MGWIADRAEEERRRRIDHRFDTSFEGWHIQGHELKHGGSLCGPVAGASAQVSSGPEAGEFAALDQVSLTTRVPTRLDEHERVHALIRMRDGRQEVLTAPVSEETRLRIFVQLINQASAHFLALETADTGERRESARGGATTSSPHSWFQMLTARARMPLLGAGVVAFVANTWWGPWGQWIGLSLLVVGFACYFRLGVHHGEPVILGPPVDGRWIALNSPADRVPSQHLTAYGQGQAVDLVRDPADGARPGFGWWPLARTAGKFPGYGQPVRAPAAGTVVRTVDRRRDHWSRTSWPALVYLLAESVRELLGPSQVLGNHVVIDAGHRQYAVLAHLRRGSVLVQAGEEVRRGQQIAECGNSATPPNRTFTCS